MMAKMQWSSIDRDFQATRKALTDARNDFDAEVRLANVQTQRDRHVEVLRQFSSLSTATCSQTIINLIPSRNPIFEGRVEVLSKLHSNLEPSFGPNPNERTQCSVVLHGVGGMGKTQTALEYVYRYKSCYAYVFWIHGESNTVLSDSFLSGIRRLPIDLEDLNPTRQRLAGLDWLQSTCGFISVLIIILLGLLICVNSTSLAHRLR